MPVSRPRDHGALTTTAQAIRLHGHPAQPLALPRYPAVLTRPTKERPDRPLALVADGRTHPPHAEGLLALVLEQKRGRAGVGRGAGEEEVVGRYESVPLGCEGRQDEGGRAEGGGGRQDEMRGRGRTRRRVFSTPGERDTESEKEPRAWCRLAGRAMNRCSASYRSEPITRLGQRASPQTEHS